MSTEISNNDDVIDSRDVIAKIEELQEEVKDQNISEDEDNPLQEELDILLKLAEECQDYAEDWEYGETLIRDSYFEDYARELAEDIGAIDNDAHWPNTCIDWEKAAGELQMDYTSVEYDGITYWIR